VAYSDDLTSLMKVFLSGIYLMCKSCLWQDAFFGRGLLDKCKENKLDDLDLESDDDRNAAASGAATEESTEHFSSVSVAEMLEFGNSTAHVSVSQSNQLPQVSSQKVDALGTSASWQAAKAVCGDLTNIPPTGGHDEDSDKEHNIGRQQAS